MTELQQRLSEMLAWFHGFCEGHGLTYYAIGGTLLGAVRHKGFIPWDDDVDVGLPRPDYEKFIELMKGRGGRYVAETIEDGNKDFIYAFCKLYDTSSTVVYSNRYKTTRGIFLDIFPLDGAGDTKKRAVKYYRRVEFKNRLIIAKRARRSKKNSFVKNAAVVVAKLLPFSWRKSIVKLHKSVAKRDYSKSAYVGNLFGHWHEREIVEREWFGTPQLYDFEDIQICGPQDADKYLTAIYGDYMTPPPEDKRKSEHDYISMDLNKSYLDVNKGETV